MKIKNQNNVEDVVTVEESELDGHVYLKVGEDPSSRQAQLRPAEARAVAYALLFHVEQLSRK